MSSLIDSVTAVPWACQSPKASFESAFQVPVVVENDGNCVALAEGWTGSAAGVRNYLALTLGTGIGGGIVIDGELYRGAFGTAGEFGHTTVVPDGRRCACGNRGCWEMYCSGTAAAAAARIRVRMAPSDPGRPAGGTAGRVATRHPDAGVPIARVEDVGPVRGAVHPVLEDGPG